MEPDSSKAPIGGAQTNSELNPATKIRTFKTVYPQIYAYTLPDLPDYNGSQKIGYTERKDVHERIREQTHTAAVNLRYDLKWSGPAFFADNITDFRDGDLHKYLCLAGIENRTKLGSEWFYFDGTPERSKELFDNFRRDGMAGLQNQNDKTPYQLRPEQEAAVQQTLAYFQAHSDDDTTDEQPAFLWNAKPRFGKTLATYDLAKRLDAKKVLIVTNRPAIANSWYDDFAKFIDGYYFISTTDSLNDRPTLTREQYNAIVDSDKRQITFLSLQDLKGSIYFGGSHKKLGWVHDLDWDLLIVDEAHEGVDTDRTDAAFDIIKRKYALYLSGTPFKALANAKFPQEAIYNWTYLDEQKAKADELTNSDDSGVHTDLPDLRLFTYRISEMTASSINAGIDIDDETYDYSFDLNEFFATNSKHEFIHEADVRTFLHNLATNQKYPFSTPELRNELKHTFWYVGNRVDSVKALAKLLNEDPVFKDYEVIIAAGDGKSFEEESQNYRANEKSFDRVKKAIATHDKTITLSCGQLTTGVTIKEWSAVLMLTDITSPAIYMQAAFRAQNPYHWVETIDSQPVCHRKKSAYLFDFSPTRVLRIYDSFANALNPVAAAGQITETQRRDNIRELLNFFPVISEDRNGRMVELDAGQVLTFPNALAATEVVKARFMSNLLFNSSIKNVFNLPRQAEDILNKMDVETNKRVADSKVDLNLNHGRELEANTTKRINENQGVILGEKIYASGIDRAVDNFTQSIVAEPAKAIEGLTAEIDRHTEPIIAKIKDAYHLTKDETDELRQQIQEKQKVVVDEYVSQDISQRHPEQLKQQLQSSIENDLVHQEVEKQEQKVVETERKSKEEQVKEHLRAFTRTIPMCIMANHTGREITIDNFDEVITDEDFEDLTNITKAEFAMLRDGFDYDDDNGVRQHFDGVFDKYCFNAAIAEFVEKKNQLGKYWLGDQHDIFEWIPNQKNNQIFTPRKVVTMMVDDLEREYPYLFNSTSSRFIDLYMKSGLYVTEIAKRLYKNTRHFYSNDDECIKHILENQVYGLAPTNILYNITLSTIFSGTEGMNIKTDNIKQYDLLTDAKNGTARQAVMALFNNSGDPMFKFDAVVGNPPYQEMNSANKMSRSIYPDFTRASQQVGDIASLVMPARWMSGENGPYHETDGFIKDIVGGSHLKKFTLFPNSQDVFNGVDIKGGVCTFIWDKSYDKDLVNYTVHDKDKSSSHLVPFQIADNIIIRFPELISIVQKIFTEPVAATNGSMRTLVSSRNPFGFVSDLFVKNNEGVSRISENKLSPDDYLVHGLLKGKRTIRYIPNNELKKNVDGAKSYKVFLPRANGSGTFGEVFSTPMIGTPMTICTDTFLQVGQFNNELEAANLLSYIKTKFFRAMVGVKKTAVFNYKDCFTFVPIQDFTADSDIDWTKSIPEIDQQLYRKYGLTNEEIGFIETHVKPMD